MKTHSDEIILLVTNAIDRATSLAGRNHSPEDFKAFLNRVGSAVELFLKKHIYLGAHTKWTFERLIDGLAPMGVAPHPRAHLHALRMAYNTAKHESAYQAPVGPVLATLQNAKTALEELSKLGLGDSNKQSNAVLRRLLWFAAWDHYFGGDTEISIFLPCSLDIDIPPGFETIYVRMEDWDTIKSELVKVGSTCFGRQCVPEKFFNFWSRQGDFLEAGSFEGDLRDMIVTFARHEHVEDILPELKRENEHYSMLAAALFSGTDLARSGNLPEGVEEITESIITTAALQYAAPSSSRFVQRYAAAIARLIAMAPRQLRAQITGPIWADSVQYVELSTAQALQSNEFPIMILEDGRLVARI